MTRKLSKLEINGMIKQINRMNLDDADYEYIKTLFRKMTEGLRFFVQRRSGADSLYHVRRTGGEKVTKVDQILAPPNSIVINYQRCNPPGQARFYAASTRMAAIKESRCGIGEVIYIGQWINKTEYPVSAALSTNEELFNFDSQSNEDVFYAYIDALFTRRIHATFSSDYKLTAALSEILMSGLPKSIDNEDGLIALKFPSTVSHGTNVHNTVMHPSFLAKNFELMHVLECEVVNGDNNEITVVIKDTATNFDDGKIIWTGSANILPCLLCSDGARMFFNDNGRLKIATIDFEPDADFIFKFLNE
ncbi:hypothetical protein RAG39_22650 [Klebsiella quasipneumoniae subsp. quasipneumoniae]|uniref:hypothetical protein n=1 Tax=Klebsiella quasipneumoniae TaxID=1463165 RepID=UPI00300627EB|nr:hypothetical protein [Klebsiella quasipneumoniae subsp. quasipneumoniae]